MKVAVMTTFGGPEVFRIEERADLSPEGDELVIEVRAAGINRPDVFQRKGHYPAPPNVIQEIPGLEVSGVVRAVGPDAKKFKVGKT